MKKKENPIRMFQHVVVPNLLTNISISSFSLNDMWLWQIKESGCIKKKNECQQSRKSDATNNSSTTWISIGNSGISIDELKENSKTKLSLKIINKGNNLTLYILPYTQNSDRH